NMVGEMETKEKPKPTPDYLMQLMNDKKLMSSLPNFCGIFNHLERLLDEEISRVRKDMYNDTLNGSTEKKSSELPDAVGPIVQLQEKLYVPVKEYPDFNFVGRILGPRGLTAKQLEAETGCKIMVRGKGSMRDKKKEEQNRGKPNWEHLNEDLHVLITVEDAQNRAEIKLKRAVEEVKKLLVPAAEGEDSLKKMQLMELAILNGTYRDANIKSPALAFSLAATAQAPRIITGPTPVLPPTALRTPTPAGPTIMPLIRQIQTAAVMPNGTPHPTATIVPPGPESGLIYTPYEYPYTLAPATSILEYPIEPSGVLVYRVFNRTRSPFKEHRLHTLFKLPRLPLGGLFEELPASPIDHDALASFHFGAVATKVRRHDMRVHPYQRVVTADRVYEGL
uniref:QKI, KH domain containing, RNA binding 2 n=1 Tax=Lepisosteus oculatus TaxID=7918 RepID=W5NID5_LEPOC